MRGLNVKGIFFRWIGTKWTPNGHHNPQKLHVLFVGGKKCCVVYFLRNSLLYQPLNDLRLCYPHRASIDYPDWRLDCRLSESQRPTIACSGKVVVASCPHVPLSQVSSPTVVWCRASAHYWRSQVIRIQQK